MDQLVDQLQQLSISIINNLEHVGFDPDHPQTLRYNLKPNDWAYSCQNFVITVILMYSFLFSTEIIRRATREYTRARPDEKLAEEFFLKYNVPEHTIVKDEHYYSALNLVTEWFRPKELIHPVHFTDLRWYPWKLSTNAERPFSTSKDLKQVVRQALKLGLTTDAKMSFHNLFNQVFIYCRRYTHHIKEGQHVPLHHITLHIKPALTHIAKKAKVRTVFGVSKCLIFIEAMFFWPLFSCYFTSDPTPLLWNYESLNGGWYRLNDEYRSNFSAFKPIINIDWSEFDMRVYFSMWRDIRAKVKTYFCFCGRYHPSRTYPSANTAPLRLERLWNWIGYAYENSLCVSPTGKLFKRHFAGMPSGIFCTQFYDSFYNGVMIVTILLSLGQTVSEKHFLKLMGDDALFGLLENIPLDTWADFLEAFALEAKLRFNSELSPSKCDVSAHIHGASVLSYQNWNGMPKRDPEQLLAQLLHPKSLRDTPQRLMARAIGIYFASGGDKRLRPICEYIYSELEFRGVKPNPKGLKDLFGDESIYFTFFDLSYFPSETEVISRLVGPSSRSKELQDRYWPLDHFLVEAGSCLH
ncbi:RNA-dependent RNA polymerase [viral metagenome]|uniref:RNA-dependent RNA polymerase n=1 Tax=viral metagenome TaxID=1070528 RepID=A0A6L2ZKB0_9ZZZZ